MVMANPITQTNSRQTPMMGNTRTPMVMVFPMLMTPISKNPMRVRGTVAQKVAVNPMQVAKVKVKVKGKDKVKVKVKGQDQGGSGGSGRGR